MSDYHDYQQRLQQLKQAQAYRQIRQLEFKGTLVNQGDEKDIINFSSNDYLGLASVAPLQQRFFTEYQNQPHWMSSSSSRALTGSTVSHQRLEQQLAKDYNKSAALLFNSGYHANTGILPALCTSRDLILADKLVHASLIDGCQLSKATLKRFAHNDMAHLQSLLDKHQGQFEHIWIISESLFSMDGDYADLAKLVELKKRYNALLYLDEAHAVGCLGKTGLGLAEQLNLVDEIDIIVATFGKALAGFGAYAVADKILIDCMVNFCRTWLFSTALPPITVDWNYFIWQQLASFNQQRKNLDNLTTSLKRRLSKHSIEFIGDSYIVPILREGNQAVVELAQHLQQQQILALPIRSPTVAKGCERIRLSITANMNQDDIENCVTALV